MQPVHLLCVVEGEFVQLRALTTICLFVLVSPSHAEGPSRLGLGLGVLCPLGVVMVGVWRCAEAVVLTGALVAYGTFLPLSERQGDASDKL